MARLSDDLDKMKRLTVDRRNYFKRIAANRVWRRQRRFVKKKYSSFRENRDLVATRTRKFVAPAVFSLATQENRDVLMSFLRRLQEHVKNGGRASINFDKTTQLIPDGTLLFVAVLSCLLQRYPGRVTSSYPVDPVVEQLFQHIGVLGWLGNTPRVTITADNVRYWHFLQGITTDMRPLKELFDAYSNDIQDRVRDGLSAGLGEAVTNTIQHAYIGESERNVEESGKRWWLFTQKKDDKLTVVVCDLGIGIPDSLVRKWRDDLKYILRYKKHRDMKLIEVAVQSTRSRTRLPHRGKGLPEMLEFVKSGDVGGFRIYSLRGAFSYDAENITETGIEFDTGIPGTLIMWTVPIVTFAQGGLG